MKDGEETRRQFLRVAAAGTAGLLIGCGTKRFAGGGPTADAGGSDGGEDAGHVVDSGPTDARAPLDATPECLETEDNILGPFYREGAPMNADLVEDGMAGTRLSVTGRVLDVACAPLAGALLDIWQANDAGAYDNVGYVLRGKVLTDADGRFAFQTIVPGHYLNGAQYRPAHIHVIASGGGVRALTTQLYFEGDEYNAIDPWFQPSLAMTLEDVGDGTKRTTFDFVLVPA
jgi:protocatechuate 3,4-dioxygenase beta subunit